MRRASVLVAIAIACACSSSAKDPNAPPEEVTFPKTFLWGSATAGFQIEKGDLHTDWSHWVHTPGKIKHGDDPDVGGPDALHHVDEDVKALASGGQNAYRMSIEWGRIYPTREAFDADTPDADAIAAYDDVLAKLHAANVTPMVTLWHFSLPDWLSDPSHPNDPQGWERPETTDLFVEWCARMAKRYGDRVDWWITLNEPLVTVVTGYLQGGAPPGVLLDTTRAFAVARTQAKAHAKAYDAIHANDPSAQVSIAAHQRTFHAYDDTDPDDVAAVERVRYVWDLWFYDAVVKGDWDDDVDGKLDGPNDRRGDPALKGRADFVGINYYSDTLVSAHKGVILPVIQAGIFQDRLPTDRPKTDVAWDIYPEGFRTVLLEAKNEWHLPIVVTENGIADRDDHNRPRFLAEHLYEMGRAIAEGADVRGYFHWSLMDNFEWQNGFCPKFGLESVDPATGARTPRPSAATYRDIIASGRVRRSDIAKLAPYVTPPYCD